MIYVDGSSISCCFVAEICNAILTRNFSHVNVNGIWIYNMFTFLILWKSPFLFRSHDEVNMENKM